MPMSEFCGKCTSRPTSIESCIMRAVKQQQKQNKEGENKTNGTPIKYFGEKKQD